MNLILRNLLFPFIGISIAAIGVACDGKIDETSRRDPDASASPNAEDGAAGMTDPDVPLIPASQVDLLLVVDNSASMAEKAKRLADSIGVLIRDVARTNDLHIGVISSSLGTFGAGAKDPSDHVCNPDNPRSNDRALLRVTDSAGRKVGGAADGFLRYEGGDIESVVRDAQELILGVGETGCGFEAQLEATYRFLVQPDPWVTIGLDANNLADPGSEIDYALLRQRKAFLRPNSALVVVMITDEDDSAVDPMSVGGQGWAFMSRKFPGSKVFRGDAAQGTTAPRGMSICEVDPGSPNCTSCGFQSLCDPDTAACKMIKDDPRCRTSPSSQHGDGFDGYYGPTEDQLSVRFHRMRERYGIDPQYPISRYVDGLTRSRVPNRGSEHPVRTSGGRREIAGYSATPTCTNPIFSATLPGAEGDELCSLPRSTRSRELVLFTILGGLPEALAGETPNFSALVGANPDQYDFDGIDPHMIPSTVPRPGLPPPSRTLGDNGGDPAHGREFITDNDDLQYACTFALEAPHLCSPVDPSCDCDRPDRNPPLCSATAGERIRGKAYPTTRPLRVARGLGDRAVVGSICASAGYDATMRTLAKRLAPRLAR